jgi:hypothetical protein
LGTINTSHNKNSGKSFFVLNISGKKIELKNIQEFLLNRRDVVANFLIASIWAIIKQEQMSNLISANQTFGES